MAIPQSERKQIERDLRAYCDDIPEHARYQVRLEFSIHGSSIELFEERVRWDKADEWFKLPIAKFRYNASRALWELFCMHRDLKWHKYEPMPTAGRFGILLAEVERDPTNIFWG